MLTIAVCDDELNEIEKIQDYGTRLAIRQNIEVKVDGYLSGEELLSQYEIGRYQIIMLDVEMGATDGILTAGRIRRIPDHEVIIMYVSRYPQYMQASFDVRAAQYISKPMSYDVFEEKIINALRYHEEEKEQYILFTYENMKYQIKDKDIILIESTKKGNRILRVTTKQGEFDAKGTLSDYGKNAAGI